MNTVTLYHGDNGSHEFYENELGDVCIIRHHGKPHWFPLWPQLDTAPYGPLSRVVRELSEIIDQRIAIDPSLEWRRAKPRRKRMELTPIDA